jgi:SAM-dependent methyltransferase
MRYDGQPNDPDEVVGVISSMIPTGARVLDVGCGTGSVTKHVISNRGATVIGLEPDEARARRARERGLVVHMVPLSADIIESLGEFDVVLFADVLEHLADPWSILTLAKSALAPDGRIVASVPNVAHWSVRTDIVRGRFAYRESGIMDATHLRWFTEAGVRILFESAGVTVDAIKATAGYDLSCYMERFPWRRMSPARRAAIIRRAVKRWPRLFGCQWVISGRPARVTR